MINNFFIKNSIDDKSVSKVKELLGTHFKGLYGFFCEYFFKFKQNTYTILLVRRCSVLSGWFLNLIFKNLNETIRDNFIVDISPEGLFTITNKHTNAKNVIINDIFLKSNYIFDSRYEFVILDDICIHGRHLTEIEKEIRDNLFAESKSRINIKKVVYMLSKDSAFESVDSFYCESKGLRWKNLSNSMVDCINYLNLPYISYLNSYIKFNFPKEEFEKNINHLKQQHNLIVHSFETQRQKILGKQSFMVVEKNIVLEKWEEYKCCRIYYNSESKTFSVIPYVILAPMGYKKIPELFARYVKNADDLTFNKNNTEYLYMLLNSVASNYYGKYFCNKYLSHLNLEEDYYHTLLFSYGAFVADHILKDLKELKSHVDEKFSIVNDLTSEDMDSSKQSQRLIDCALRTLWLENEINACFLMGKEEKLDLDPYIKNSKDNTINIINVMGLIKRCDTGTACISIQDIERDSIVKSRLDVGELGINLIDDTIKLSFEDKEKIKALKAASDYYKDIF